MIIVLYVGVPMVGGKVQGGLRRKKVFFVCLRVITKQKRMVTALSSLLQSYGGIVLTPRCEKRGEQKRILLWYQNSG